ITYDEYIPYALWCSEVNAAACVFLDTTGYAFAMAPNLSGGAFMRFVTSGRVPEIGQVLLDEAQLSALVRLVALLAAQEWFISHIEIDQVGDVFLQVVGGGELKVTAADDPDAVVENLLVVLASPEFTHITPGNFQYIDLRFGNKVFLNEEMIAPPVEYASNTPTDIQ
ncbi:hypothetical protein KC906_02970, partial [Candidatus Kaiserbacteria bacterium]|nr:hypothetical protein [Candidatus Kaiserbacteria bacterium]